MNDDDLRSLTVEAFLRRLSTREPVPGGGSAAALAGAMGAALLHMVVELSGDRATDGNRSDLQEIGAAAATWHSELLNLAELDARAYDGVIQARRMPRDTERDAEARRALVHAATQEATRMPLEVVRCGQELLRLAERLAPVGHRNAISDVGVAGLLAVAAIRGAALNVQINLPFLPEDDPLRAEAPRALDEVLETLDERDRALRAVVAERLA